MAKKATITDVSSGFGSTTTLDANFDALNDKFDNTISRDGSTPNAMEADFDLGGYDVLNGGDANFSRLYLNGTRVTSASSTPSWEGEWTTSTAYVVDDISRNDGNAYICLVDHTSGTFSTDLAANKWELFASKGSAGAGSGDLLAANNLSDVSSADSALANLGGGTKGIAIFKDTTSAAVIAELGITATVAELNYVDGVTSNVQVQLDAKQASDATLTALAGSLTAANKVPYATGTDTLGELDLQTTISDSDTSVPTSGAVVDYVAANAASGRTLLATVATTSGSTVSATSLDFTNYTKLEFVYSGVSPSTAAAQSFIKVQFGSGTLYQHTEPVDNNSPNALNGFGWVHISTGVYSSTVGQDDTAASGSYTGSHGDVSSETSITWDWDNAATFDAGEILVYGVV